MGELVNGKLFIDHFPLRTATQLRKNGEKFSDMQNAWTKNKQGCDF